jgi:hypothetical protein
MVTRWVWFASIALLAMVMALGSASQGLTAPQVSALDHKPLTTAMPSVGTKQRGLSLANAEASRRVYELMPELPLENQYTSSVSGEVAVNNTLVSRLINYHTFVKGRTPVFRLDWKLTLADFIGVNERINIETYPGSDTLTANPAEADIAIIQGLNRAQREQLVGVLVSIFMPDASSQPAPDPLPSPVAPQAPEPTPGSSTSPSQPRPGDAQLLLP